MFVVCTESVTIDAISDTAGRELGTRDSIQDQWPGADSRFLEMGLICIKVWGVRFADFKHFS